MISENVKIGLTSLRKSRIRSFLTMSGIIIGVVSVVTIVSLGEGVKRQISGQVEDLGTNLITVKPGNLVNRDDKGEITGVNLFANVGTSSLTDEDIKSIEKLDGVQSVAALRTISGIPEYNGQKFPEGNVIVTTQNLTEVIDHKVEFGTFFDEEMMTKRDAIIGPGVAEKLFKETIPIGKSFEIRGKMFTVQGVFESFREVPISSSLDYNNAIFIPLPIVSEIVDTKPPIYEVLAKAKTERDVNPVAAAIDSSILKNHQDQRDFTVLKQDEVSVASDELLDLLTKMIVGMAAVTLFVGGIGIMNVMLVSVSERTREIGIRKAIGASNSQIRSQFMTEAIILSIWGVFWGVLLSAALNITLRIVTDLEPVLLWQPIVIAGLVSIAVGVFFGVIPAIKASRKDPIESLRPN